MRRLRFIAVCMFMTLVTMQLPAKDGRHRILISTDIGGTDPDDNQSMIHLLMYANEFDIEGLISSPSFGDGSKEEIERMIDMYAVDLPKLKRGLKKTGETTAYPSPKRLKRITKQGRMKAAPLCGYGEPTEGSRHIVDCARRNDRRPLWVLVWGALEDVAQALHDAPDIAGKIRVYWIGGPNKKWGCNAYNYIVCNFPDLWFIENNSTYRGFIGTSSDSSVYEAGYWNAFMKGAGVMGDDFINYYRGVAKMGDTPSLLYLMKGDVDNPCADHWGGRFESMKQSPKYIVKGSLCNEDTIPVYSLMEWRIKGPEVEITADSACFTLQIDKQSWAGFYVGAGVYMVRYAPKAPAVLDYSIDSPIPGFPVHSGTFVVMNNWPATDLYSVGSNNMTVEHVGLGDNWFTDVADSDIPKDSKRHDMKFLSVAKRWQGAHTTACWRVDVMRDWSKRFGWMKQDY